VSIINKINEENVLLQVLDVKDLDIKKVTCNGESVPFIVGPTVFTFGQKMEVQLPKSAGK
jgi:hypothetical protein